ncbi:MAG: T9SS type A sorting domain-containing protein [Bacteroidota bacterium]
MNKLFSNTLLIALLFTGLTHFSQASFLQWADQIGGLSTDNARGSAIDKDGNVITVGFFQGTMDFDPGVGTFTLASVGTTNSFVLKIDKTGNFVWAKSFVGSTGSNSAVCVDVDITGNVYIGGSYSGATDMNPGAGTYTINGASNFICKLNALGNFVWVKEYVGGASIESITVDASQNVYTTGVLSGTADFNPATATYTLASSSPGVMDAFVAKLNIAGNFVWAQKFGSTALDRGYSIVVDNNKNVYAAGIFTGTVDFNSAAATNNLYSTIISSAYKTDIYILKLDSLGNYLWAQSVGGPGQVQKPAIAVDNLSNAYIVGYCSGSIDFISTNITTTGSDGFILKLNSAGSFMWVKNFSGAGSAYPNAVATDLLQNVYVSGSFSGTADFDAGAATTAIAAQGSNDAFITKYNTAGNFMWAKGFGGAGSTTDITSLHADSLQNVYASGIFTGAPDLDPNANTLYFASQGGQDAFVLKLTNCIYDAPNICLVTVDSLALNNVIYWDKSVYPLADSFIVYRYDAFATVYKKIGAKSINQSNFLVDTARTVGGPNGGDPQYSSSRYKLAIRGTCGSMGTKGLYHESIFIQQNNQNFSWNAYGIEGQSSPATGYQFMRDDINNGTWQVLVNTGGLSTTDPNYLNYPNGNWRVDALGFSCNPTAKTTQQINKSKSNVKNNFVITSASEMELKANTVLSPIPAGTELVVHFSNHQQIKTEFTVTDVLGKVVSKMETLALDKVTIALNNMSSGVYFLKITQGKLQATQKFVKE